MRWSLQWQLLAPMVAVLVMGIGLASGVSAYLGITSIRQLQHDQLQRAVNTLSEATFPLTEPVLHNVRSLTGAEYVVVSSEGRVQIATLPITPQALPALHDVPGPSDLTRLAEQPLQIGTQTYFAARVPLKRSAKVSDASQLFVLVPNNETWSEARRAAWPPLIAGSAAMVISLITATAVARRILRPVRRLGEQAERIAAGDFRPLPPPRLNDEIRDLGAAINRMAGRLEEHTEQVRRSERLRTLDLLSSGLAHQMRNSVMGARMAIELHRADCSAAGDESLNVSLSQLSLMESYLQRFLTLGKADAGVRIPIELGAFLDELLELVRPSCRHAGVRLVATRAGEHVWIEGDPELLRQMLTNVLFNALEAVRSSGTEGCVTVDYELADGRAIMRIGDSGPGPSAAVQDAMFQPFVSDKPDGTGLGLPVARQIALRHGGTIDWRCSSGMTYFVISLPACRDPSAPREPSAIGTESTWPTF